MKDLMALRVKWKKPAIQSSPMIQRKPEIQNRDQEAKIPARAIHRKRRMVQTNSQGLRTARTLERLWPAFPGMKRRL